MSGPGRWRPIASVGLASALTLLLVVPGVSLASSPPSGRSGPIRGEVGAGFSADVYWNGANVAGAGSPSSAITLSSNSQVTVRYFWNYTDSPAGFSLSDARLAMTYFGFALSTRDVPPVEGATASNGSFDMAWTVGAIEYVLSGTYRVTATLFASNGSTVWSDDFYVHLVPPFAIGAIVPILLIVILIVELVAIARSGRQAAMRTKPTSAEPPSGGTEPPPSPGSAPPSGPAPPPGGPP
jgi:hypothetical protein